MTQRPPFDEIQKQHQALLRQLSEIDDVDPDDPRVKAFLEGVKRFLDILAQAGTYTENSERRSLLRDFIRYWSSEINNKTGNLRIVQLKPFDLSLAHRRSDLKFFRRPFALVVALSLMTIIILVVFILIRLSTSPPSAFHCPTSQQVSIWMKVSVSQVTSESCAFTAGNNGKQLSGVVCTSQDGGTTIEYIPVSKPKTLVVTACDGSKLPDIWGLTIRFVSGYPSEGASVCTIAQRERNNLPGWTIQSNC